MKKFLAILLTLAVVLSLCACGKQSQSGDNADGKITLTVGLPTNAKVTSFEENALTKWLEEQCDVNIDFIEYAGGSDISTQVSTTVAARQELPDILYGVKMAGDAIGTYGKDGYFVDLTPYYEDKEGASKTFWTRLEEDLTEAQQEYVVRTITDSDTDKIYGVPTIETSLIDKRKFQPWINQTWLDKLNLPMPQNADELYDVLVAFKTQDPNGNGDPTDEIPLFGSQKAAGSAGVVTWIINMFLYYDTDHRYQDYNGDGQLEFVYSQNEYREALKFLNKLYKEGLLTNMVYTIGSTEMKSVTTPASNVALCGIFCGHLTTHVTRNSELLYDYVPMPLWGNAVEGDLSCNLRTFISGDCDNPDKAFELLMAMFSWDGSMRARYGEYGVNWTDADPGAKSLMGLDAAYKLIADAQGIMNNSATWGSLACCLNHYAEGETAQLSEDMNAWARKKAEMNAESRRIFDAAVEANNPENLCPPLVYTVEESESIEMIRTNIGSYTNKQEMAFITGIGADINSDADWQKFQKGMADLGLENFRKLAQTAYDRQ